ncbi:MAG: S8 family peptidase, partial [Chitinophagales bacterium]|nr:S8 family peptidase [Chitinophagales bacterium]
DKNTNIQLPPESFLSPRAIQRRAKHNISVAENDYPVYEPYKQAVSAIADSVIHTLKWFNAITVVLNNSLQLQNIAALPFVKEVKPITFTPAAWKDRSDKLEQISYELPETEDSAFYGRSYSQLKMIQLPRLHEIGYWGDGVFIAVFDNGFRLVDSLAAFRHLFEENRMKFSYNYQTRSTNVFDEGSHGTHVLSCISAYIPGSYVGAAPKADIALFKTEINNSETIIEEFNWAEAAEKADSLGADIFTTSLGYSVFENDYGNHDYFDMDGNSTVITRASNIASSKGILVFTSAGNEGGSSWRFITAPADGKDVVAVGAVRPDRSLAPFSSRGPNASGAIKPDVCAQGTAVTLISTDGAISQGSGTSFACPQIAGAAACLLQAAPEATAPMLKQAILRSGHLYASPDNDMGYGIPNFFKALIYLSEREKLLELPFSAILFPNPFQHKLNVLIQSKKSAAAQIELWDLMGRKVFAESVLLDENDVKIINPITGNSILPGIYYATVTLNDEKQIFRLIKNSEP